MQRGLLDRLVVGNHQYVVQTEDRGSEKAQFLVSVFKGGVLVYQRAVPYGDLLGLELADEEEVLDSTLRSVHGQVLRDLTEGLLFPESGND